MTKHDQTRPNTTWKNLYFKFNLYSEFNLDSEINLGSKKIPCLDVSKNFLECLQILVSMLPNFIWEWIRMCARACVLSERAQTSSNLSETSSDMSINYWRKEKEKETKNRQVPITRFTRLKTHRECQLHVIVTVCSLFLYHFPPIFIGRKMVGKFVIFFSFSVRDCASL